MINIKQNPIIVVFFVPQAQHSSLDETASKAKTLEQKVHSIGIAKIRRSRCAGEP